MENSRTCRWNWNLTGLMSSESSIPAPKFGLKDKEFWENIYDREVDNFEEFKDVGEVWFDHVVSGLEEWIYSEVWENLQTDIYSKERMVLDVGCGNGVFCFELSRVIQNKCPESKWKFFGIDYCDKAVELARGIQLEQFPKVDDDANSHTFEFLAMDALTLSEKLMHADPSRGGLIFDIVHDKGTFDVISLRSEMEIHSYIQQLEQVLLEETGVLVLTSCNHTNDEICEFISKHSLSLKHLKSREYRVVEFFGHKGSQVSTNVFIKKKL